MGEGEDPMQLESVTIHAKTTLHWSLNSSMNKKNPVKLKNSGCWLNRETKKPKEVNYVLYLLLVVKKPGRQVAYYLRALNGPERA
jgi:hypothetical protein